MSATTCKDYNGLTHLRKLAARLSIYGALFLSKEMRDSSVKALPNQEFCLAELDDSNYVGEEELTLERWLHLTNFKI